MLGHRGLSPQRNRQESACYSRRGSPRKIVCSPLYPARIAGICWHAASTSTCALPIRPGAHIRHVFFPTDSCISLITPIDGRAGRAKGELLSYTLRSDTAVVDQRCPCPASTIPNEITCWLRCHRQRGIDCTRICGSSRCRSLRFCTSPATSCATFTFRRTRSCRCCTC